MRTKLPAWVNLGLLPLLNLLLAFLVAGVVVILLGENPLQAVELLVYGAFGYGEAIGYTLYYATNFIFTGLAVAIAFHAGLFNIGGEGQAMLGGLGVGLVGVYLGWLPWPVSIPLAIVAAMAFGGLWGFIPGWLQAVRGSHTVITTIMLNFVAGALMTYLMVNVLIKPGQASPESVTFPTEIWLPALGPLLGLGRSPFNFAFVIALVACAVIWVFVWKTRLGYELRVAGKSEPAAVYGGISPKKQIILAMTPVRCLGRHDGAERDPRRPAPADPGLHLGLRLRRHRRGADGPQPPGRHRAGGTAVRRPLPGRLRARLRHAAHQSRHGGGHPGPGHPVRRRPREHVAQPARSAVRPAPCGAGPSRSERAGWMNDLWIQLLLLADSTLRLATPLVLCALAGLFTERAGVTDIGLEGKMLGAAFAAAAAAQFTGSAWVGLVAAIAFSWSLAMVHGFACITHRGDQVVSGVALNIVVAGLGPMLADAWFRQAGRMPVTGADTRFAPIDLPFAGSVASVPVLGPLYAEVISGHNIIVYLAALAVPLSAWVLYRTRFGLRIRAAGESPEAVDTAGISVEGLRYRALMVTGLLSGFAGAYLSIAQNAGFLRDMWPAKAIWRWRP